MKGLECKEVMENNKNEYELNFPIVASHAISHAMADIMPALDTVARMENISIPLHKLTVRAQFAARELSSKVKGLAELMDSPNGVSSLKMSSYEVVPFFTKIVDQVNRALSDKTDGKILLEVAEESRDDVLLDFKRIATIMYYMISNSMQHGRTDNKNVKFICNATQDSFELIIRDYGGGVPKEVQPILFEKFRAEYDITNEFIGMLPPKIQGIGLPLCRKLARDMGGDISFKNYRSGAQFTVVIPQESCCMQEVSEYIPDDNLMQNCMSPLFLYLLDLNEDLES